MTRSRPRSRLRRTATRIASGWLLLSAAALASATPACGNVCTDLSEICPRCADADYRESCEATVDSQVQDLCDSRLGVFRANCTAEPTGSGGATATSTTTLTTATAATTTTGGGTDSAGGRGGAGGAGGGS